MTEDEKTPSDRANGTGDNANNPLIQSSDYNNQGPQLSQGKRENRRTISRKTPLKTALRLLEHFEQQGIRTIVYHDESYWKWNGFVYERFSKLLLNRLLYGFLSSHCMNADGTRFNPISKDVDSVSHALIGITDILEGCSSPVWLDERSSPRAELVLVCKNGILDLTGPTLLTHTPELFAINRVEYSYEPNAPTPKRWMEFLGEIWGDDIQSMDTLHELLGYFLSGLTSFQVIVQLIGPTRSGKGTILRIIAALVGPANVVSPTFASFGETFGLQALIGKRLAAFSDVRIGKRVDMALVAERLLSVSGEDVQTINRKYQSAWVGTLSARIVLVSNELLSPPDTSGALPSRMLVLRMTNSFLGRENPNLTDELLQELPGILNLAIAGLHRLLKRGRFVQPAAAHAILEEMHTAASPIGTFVRELCEVDTLQRVEVDTLYSRYCRWCSERGCMPVEKFQLGKDLHAVVPSLSVSQPRKGEGRIRCYVGIGLK